MLIDFNNPTRLLYCLCKDYEPTEVWCKEFRMSCSKCGYSFYLPDGETLHSVTRNKHRCHLSVYKNYVYIYDWTHSPAKQLEITITPFTFPIPIQELDAWMDKLLILL